MPNKSTKINLLVCENLHGKQIYLFLKKHYKHCTFRLICPDDIRNMTAKHDGVTVIVGGISNGECVYKGDMLTLAVFEKFGFYAEVHDRDVLFINLPKSDADYQNLLRVIDYVIFSIGGQVSKRRQINWYLLIVIAAVIAVIFAVPENLCEVKYGSHRTLFLNVAQYDNISVIKNPCFGKTVYDKIEFAETEYQFWARIDKSEYDFYPFKSSIEYINNTIIKNATIKTAFSADENDKILVILSDNSITVYKSSE